MKSKTKISHVYSEFRDTETRGEYSQFKYPVKARTDRKHRVNTRDFSPIKFMWETSIPENWFKLAEPSLFLNMRLERQKSRNTLQFLEETQKYIYNIRKPLIQKKFIKNVQRRNLASFGHRPLLTTARSQMLKTVETCSVNGNKHELLPRCSSIEKLKSTISEMYKSRVKT